MGGYNGVRHLSCAWNARFSPAAGPRCNTLKGPMSTKHHPSATPRRALSRKTIRALVWTAITFIVGHGLLLWLGHYLAAFLEQASDSPFYHTRVVPFTIGCLPFVLGLIIITYLLMADDDAPEGQPRGNDVPEAPATTAASREPRGRVSPLSSEQIDLLGVLGITGVTPDLEGSAFHPRLCMSRARKQLMFMGILGSKWISDPTFEGFLKRIQLTGSTVQFLLIHPHGRSFSALTELREGHISTKSLELFRAMRAKYPCLRVKLYEELPAFRLIFFDGQTAAVSRYKLDRQGYFDSKHGWDAPHVVLSADAPWSLYHTFEDYYNSVWNRSQDLDDFFAQIPVLQPLPNVAITNTKDTFHA